MIPPRVNTKRPTTITIFLPTMSEKRPNGRIKADMTTKYEIAIHWAVGKSAEKCWAISGIITFDEPLSNAVPKMERAPEKRTNHL